MTSIWRIVRLAVESWFRNEAPRQSASLAYFALFSLTPFLLVVVRFADWLLGGPSRQRIMQEVSKLGGEEVARSLNTLTQNTTRVNLDSGATIVAIVLVIFGASGLFMELQTSLNRIWLPREDAPQRSWWRLLIRKRIISFGLVLLTGFLIAASLVIATSLGALDHYWGNFSTVAPWIPLLLGDSAIAWIVLTLLFGVVFKIVPDVRVAWKDVWVGAFATSVLFMIGKSAIAAYLVRSGLASSFGAASGILGLMVWLYYSAMIFLFGGELTLAYARIRGSLSPTNPQ